MYGLPHLGIDVVPSLAERISASVISPVSTVTTKERETERSPSPVIRPRRPSYTSRTSVIVATSLAPDPLHPHNAGVLDRVQHLLPRLNLQLALPIGLDSEPV